MSDELKTTWNWAVVACFQNIFQFLFGGTEDKLRNPLQESESHVTTDGQSASLSGNKAPIWGLRQNLYYCLTVAGLLIWCALSDERTGLSFTIAAGPRQRSHFWVGVP
jgi:hypothetical protein